MAVTIKQVARLANVSTTTVSYVLNGTGTIPETTRRRVLDAVAELGYQPHYAAQSMRGRSRTFGLMLSAQHDRLADPAYAELLAGFAGAAARRGYYLLIAIAESESEEPQLCVSLAQTGRVDGLVLLDMRIDDRRALALSAAGIPHVCAGPAPAGSAAAMIDGHAGVKQAVAHVLALGHTRIGFIQLPSDLAESEPRYLGYADALAEAGIQPAPELVVEAGIREADGFQAMLELLELPQPPTAVVASSDDLAFGALHALHEAGLRVGQDVSLVGFGDLPLAAHSQPPLTTIWEPRRVLGEQLAAMMYAAVADPERSVRTLTLAPRLVVRKSTGPPA